MIILFVRVAASFGLADEFTIWAYYTAVGRIQCYNTYPYTRRMLRGKIIRTRTAATSDYLVTHLVVSGTDYSARMKPSNVLGILGDLRIAIQHAFIPTLIAVLHSPALLFRPQELSKIFFSHVWVLYGDGTDEAGREVKNYLIPQNAYGVVLDLGAGHGHTALYLSQERVTKYVALEPNVLMHPRIKATATRMGFYEEAGTLLILSCGAEDTLTIASALGGQHKVDTLISILTFCSVPRPEQTIRRLTDDILKPGGQLLFYEHVASRRSDVLFWQRFWSSIWKRCFDGCILGRPTDRYIRSLGDTWEEFPAKDAAGNRIGIWGKEGENEEHLFWHQIGRLIKRGA